MVRGDEEGRGAGVEAVGGLGDVEGFWRVGGVLGGREVFGGPLLVRVGRHGLVWFGLVWLDRYRGWKACVDVWVGGWMDGLFLV